MANLRHALLVTFMVAACSRSAVAVDLQPGELVAPKPDTDFFQVSYSGSKRGDLYRLGKNLGGGTSLSVDQWTLRVGRSFVWMNAPALIYVQGVQGTISTEGRLAMQPGDSGWGDAALLLAAWPYADREAGEYLATALYLTLPTGSYEPARRWNLGANRSSLALQLGYQNRLGSSLQWMSAIDGVWYGRNDEYGVRRQTIDQQLLYTVQTGLRQEWMDKYSWAWIYFYSQGGENRLDGLPQNDQISLHRYQWSLTSKHSFGALALQYGADLSTRNGYKETGRVILRFTSQF